MLAAPRTGITKVANDLRDAGIIRYRRGKITVSNREHMERLACDCYKWSSQNLTHTAASA